jgi:hypothetical protein
MYTAQLSTDDPDGNWDILDPDGDYICMVLGKAAADALLSHLNR